MDQQMEPSGQPFDQAAAVDSAAQGTACFRFGFKSGKDQRIRIFDLPRALSVKKLLAAACAGPIFDIPILCTRCRFCLMMR